MKKLITFAIASLLVLAPTLVFSMNPVEVKYITRSISITSPDEETVKYDDITKIPEILYASNIVANGMAILSYYKLEIILKNAQGIMVNKDPLTNEIVVFKSENSKEGNITLKLDEQSNAQFTPDTKLALKYINSKVIVKVLNGSLLVESQGENYELVKDEIYTIK